MNRTSFKRLVLLLILISLIFFWFNSRKKDTPIPSPKKEEVRVVKPLKLRLEEEMDKAASEVDWAAPPKQEGWVSPDSEINTGTDPRMP